MAEAQESRTKLPEYLITGMKPKPKARPRVTSKGTWMPHDYQRWRQEIRACLMDVYPNAVPVTEKGSRCCVLFYAPKQAKGDSDNLLGGILDAIQAKDGYGLIDDDRLLSGCHVEWVPSSNVSIVIGIYPPGEEVLYRARIMSAIVA